MFRFIFCIIALLFFWGCTGNFKNGVPDSYAAMAGMIYWGTVILLALFGLDVLLVVSTITSIVYIYKYMDATKYKYNRTKKEVMLLTAMDGTQKILMTYFLCAGRHFGMALVVLAVGHALSVLLGIAAGKHKNA